MVKLITAMELQGSDYSIYMRQSVPGQLICYIETTRGTQNDPARFMRGVGKLGVKTRRDDAAKKICSEVVKLCGHSTCFGMTFTSLEKVLVGVWHTADELYGPPKTVRILMTGREDLVFNWTPKTLSYHFAHENPANYIPALKKLQVFSSVEELSGRDGEINRVSLTVAPGAALDDAFMKAHKVLKVR